MIDRRDLVKASVGASLAVLLPWKVKAFGAFAPSPGSWRHFEVTTRLEIANAGGTTQAWIPVPSVSESEWFHSQGSSWTTNAKSATLVRDRKYNSELLHVEWAEEELAPVVEVVSRAATRDRAIDFTRPGTPLPLSRAETQLYTEATELIPIDGIVRETSEKVTAGTSTDLERARAIYEWIIDNTYRDPNTRGCGVGDIASMLKSGNLGGKCADLNALYVGLARAAGLPARDIYGIRVAPSKFGYKSLGANSDILTKSQHCRAEVYLFGFGWVPVDPADVRKVVLEEPPGKLPLDDLKVVDARRTLFGGWETNWLPYNMACDLQLPGSFGPKLAFLMYPQAETASTRLDALDPESFVYRIFAKELTW
jgi:transglutaminase-like putative cysteine protease